MKKIIALVLILVVSTVLIQQRPFDKNIHESMFQSEKDTNWEYVKERLFDNKEFTNDESLFRGKPQKPFKFKGPILIDISGANKLDSLAVEEAIETIKTILPHKTIDYFSNYTGFSLDSITGRIEELDALGKSKEANIRNQIYNGRSLQEILEESTIRMNFRPTIVDSLKVLFKKTYLSDRSFFISRGNLFWDLSDSYKIVYSEHTKNIKFKFADTLSYKKRKQFVEYEFLRALCNITPRIKGNFSPTNYDKNIGVFQVSNYFPTISKLNKKDTFLLQKLYADDFLVQFKAYLYKFYPWQYAFSFLDKDLAVVKTWILLIIIGLVVLILSVSLFHKKKFKFSFLSYFFPALIIFSYLYILSFIHNYIFDIRAFPFQRSFTFLWFLGIVIASLVASLFLWGVEKNVIKEQLYFTYQLILKVICTIIALILPFILTVLIIYFIDGDLPKSSNFRELFVPLSVLLFLALGRGFLIYLNHYSDNLLKQKDVELSRLKQVNAEAEVRLLQSQINPHFLYNALNSIASLAPVDTVKTQKMAHSLSDLFKYTINRKGKKMSTVSDEITMVQNYLNIEKIRFGDRLQFTIEVDPELEKVEIPLFIIQPLVENAVKHGISKIEGDGEIALKIEKTTTGILIEVKDNGPYFPEGLVSGHGLQTVFDLLRLTYGDKATLNWQNTPKKSISVTITKNA